MTKLRYALLALAVAVCSAFASAQSAKDVLQRCAEKVKAASLVEAEYITSADGQSIPGNLVMDKEKFAMTGKGYGIWYDGNQLWSYSDQTGETTLSCPTIDELLEVNPFDIINHYGNRYKASLKSKSGAAFAIEMLPISKSASIKKAMIYISSSTYLPTRIDFEFSNSTKAQVEIKSIKLDARKGLPLEFIYPAAKYQGIEIIDLR